MKAAVFREHGPASNIRIEDWPTPQPAAGECLVRVRAAALNGFDPQILQKTTELKTPLPMVPAGDVAGEIAEPGPGVDAKRWSPGTRVSIVPYSRHGMMGETALGGCREYITVAAENLIPVPDGCSITDAASLPIAYGTAYRLVRIRSRIRAGERVLILGATGGVGVATVQFAKQLGAEVIACGSESWKVERLRELGADHVIDTSREDFKEAVYQRFGKPRVMGGSGGVDVVVNYIGGDTWVKSLQCLRQHGRLVTCGATAGYAPQTDIRYIWSYELDVLGSNGWTPEDQAELMRLVAVGELRPVIHAVRPLETTATSIQDLIDRKVFGKLVLTV